MTYAEKVWAEANRAMGKAWDQWKSRDDESPGDAAIAIISAALKRQREECWAACTRWVCDDSVLHDAILNAEVTE